MPRRGEVWLVDLGMAEKVRPALILSRTCSANDQDIVTVIPHATTLRGSRSEVHVSLPVLKAGAFLAQSPATVPTRRAEKYLGKMADEQVRQIEDALVEWLEIRRRV